MQPTVLFQAVLSVHKFSRCRMSVSLSPVRSISEWMLMAFITILNQVVLGLPADLFQVLKKASSDLLAGVSGGRRSRCPNHVSLRLHIVMLSGMNPVLS